MNKKVCLLIIALEGGSLLAFEIVASRLYTPFLGSALHVWTSILTMTLLALAFGYYFGSRVRNDLIPKTLRAALFFASVFILVSPSTAGFILTQTQNLNIELASIISGAFIILPPVFLMGLISPMITQFISNDLGKNAGIVYGIGTFSGVITALIFVHYLIPQIGVKNSITAIAMITITAALLSLLLKKNELKEY